jgi:outer membrane protein assembly factor BamB
LTTLLQKKVSPQADSEATSAENHWPQWRGPSRTGLVNWLPQTLSPEPKVLWEVPLAKAGLGGIAATEEYIFFGDRDLDDFQDVYRCLNATTGEQIWEVPQLAIGALDYGNSPRATPVIHGKHVIFFGAFGDLCCVEIASGEVIWHINLRSLFNPEEELPWGYCGSPLLLSGTGWNEAVYQR